MSRALLSKALIFAAGLGVGSVVTWKLLDVKYRKIADEEIASVKEAFSNKAEEEAEIDISEDEVDEKKESVPTMKELYNNMTDALGYTNYSDTPRPSQQIGAKLDINNVDRPYVISPDEYGELYDYEEIELTYYADGVLTDDADELVEDVDATVGLDSLKCFGMYEDDSVHVRNDARKCDYEILKSLEKYSERNRGPHPEEG